MALYSSSLASACNAQAIPLPQLFGLEFLDIQVSPVTDFSLSATPVQLWTKTEFTDVVTSRSNTPIQDRTTTSLSLCSSRKSLRGMDVWQRLAEVDGMRHKARNR
jgi:hypothetical protein